MNHTLSDSQLEEMIKSAVNSSGPLPPDEKFSQLISALRELQERRKAEKDSEPVAWTWRYREQRHVTNDKCRAEFVATDGDVAVLPLYRHAQPAPEKYNIGDATMRHIFTPTGMTNISDMQAVFDRVEAVLVGMDQPAPVVLDGYVMVPKEPTKEMLDEFDSIIDYGAEDSQDAWRRLLAAAPQSPGSEPATVPGKWIPVSEQKPDCWCLTCRPVTLNDMRFMVCPDCGNKRCPRANDHRNACTGSNEPGQEGSAYPDTPREVKS